MSEEGKKEKTKHSHRLTSGPIWTKKGTERDPNEIYFTGLLDFGILGISFISIFKRKPKDGDKEGVPDYLISTSYQPYQAKSHNKEDTQEKKTLVNVGSLWKKEYSDKKSGKQVAYLSGVLSAGIHGEYQVAIFNVDSLERRNEKSPDKVIQVSVQQDIKKSESGNNDFEAGGVDDLTDDDVPF